MEHGSLKTAMEANGVMEDMDMFHIMITHYSS